MSIRLVSSFAIAWSFFYGIVTVAGAEPPVTRKYENGPLGIRLEVGPEWKIIVVDEPAPPRARAKLQVPPAGTPEEPDDVRVARHLFTVAPHDRDPAKLRTPTLFAMVETLVRGKPKTTSQLLEEGPEEFRKMGIPVVFEGDVRETTVGGTRYSTTKFRMEFEGLTVRQDLFNTIRDGQSVVYALQYSDEGDRELLLKVLASVKYLKR